MQQESLEVATRNAATALAGAIEATRESRSLDSVVRSVVIAAIATVVLFALLWGLRWIRQAIERWLVRVTQAQTDALRAHRVEFVRQDRMIWFARTTVKTFHRILILLLLYEWVSLVLAQFPYTQVWSAHLNGFLFGLVAGIGSSILNAVPGMLTALVIFFIARFVGRMLDNFFEGVRTGQTKVSWLDPEVATTTRRIAKAIVWLFAFAMAYPYLPGSHTDAFKGVSVLVGLMISLGASNLIGQAGSGLILTYARVFRRGEYVSIGEHEGTITDLGMFATRLLTGQGEELTLSNSLVLGAVTKNYSRTVNGPGYILEVTATIGYDTPWRQVHAMLIEGARRTPGVLTTPAPQVFQMSLSDFYPEYRLVCQAIPTDARPRVVFLSALHANIQDVFNEFGVQIMSPHYFKDPQDPKIVPQGQWFTPPAERPNPKME
ncbi:mechanosensitive ion channel family protein [Glaciimonas soli]|uniref:Small-conductance mechanosensitive channel n=1 Tax=Glaciimonas soli TaxID=2590999 RepID=A0A843YHR9_9BURK|nr:mechanosensitive ion channel domain-containing protein [Glaciimonas soli]MQQ99278.1 mechanosensitive ion channel [Glaciimonas soli]